MFVVGGLKTLAVAPVERQAATALKFKRHFRVSSPRQLFPKTYKRNAFNNGFRGV